MNLSTRGQKLIGNPSAIVLGHMKCLSDPYSAENTKGYLNFGTAENCLMENELLAKLNEGTKLKSDHLHYGPMEGMPETQNAIKNLLVNRIGISNIQAENICIMTGASSVCEALSYCLLDEGEKILIPAPYYTGFNHDFSVRFNNQLVPFYLNTDENFSLDIKKMRQTYLESVKSGDVVKAILVTNPNNPTGRHYTRTELKAFVDFATKYDLQIITDEIYALSNLDGDFVSLLEFIPQHRDRIHFVYGMAKDFGLSGLKFGIYYSENAEVVTAIKNAAYFHTVSNLTQVAICELLLDEHFLKEFIDKNQKQLKQTYLRLSHELPFKCQQTSGGIFTFMDCRKLLKEQTFEGEKALYEYFLNDLKINFTPGGAMGMKCPGWFRCCFARPEEQVTELVRRLSLIDAKPL